MFMNLQDHVHVAENEKTHTIKLKPIETRTSFEKATAATKAAKTTRGSGPLASLDAGRQHGTIKSPRVDSLKSTSRNDWRERLMKSQDSNCEPFIFKKGPQSQQINKRSQAQYNLTVSHKPRDQLRLISPTRELFDSVNTFVANEKLSVRYLADRHMKQPLYGPSLVPKVSTTTRPSPPAPELRSRKTSMAQSMVRLQKSFGGGNMTMRLPYAYGSQHRRLATQGGSRNRAEGNTVNIMKSNNFIE